MSRLSRRDRLRTGGAAAATALASRPVSAARTGERPNILWLVSEDNNPFIGAYGDRLAHTPHIDALAKQGLLYRNAFCNAPVCAPSRFGILTGAYPEANAPANHMRADAATLDTMMGDETDYLRNAAQYLIETLEGRYDPHRPIFDVERMRRNPRR